MELDIVKLQKNKLRLRATAIMLVMCIVVLSVLTIPAQALVTEATVAMWLLGALASMVGIRVLPTAITDLQSAFSKMYTWLEANNSDGKVIQFIDATKPSATLAFIGGANTATINVPAADLPSMQVEILEALGADGEALAAEIAARQAGAINLSTYDIDLSGWTIVSTKNVLLSNLLDVTNYDDLIFDGNSYQKYIIYFNCPLTTSNNSNYYSRCNYIVIDNMTTSGINSGININTNWDQYNGGNNDYYSDVSTASYTNMPINVKLHNQKAYGVGDSMVVKTGLWVNNNYYVDDKLLSVIGIVTYNDNWEAISYGYLNRSSSHFARITFNTQNTVKIEKYELQESTAIGAKTISGVVESLQTSAAAGDGTITATLTPSLNQKVYYDAATKSALDTAIGYDIDSVTTNVYDTTTGVEAATAEAGTNAGSQVTTPDGGFWQNLGSIVLAPIRVIVACIAMIGRLVIYIVSLIAVPADGSLLPDEVKDGISFARNIEIPYFEMTYWQIISVVLTFMYSLVYVKFAKKYVVGD